MSELEQALLAALPTDCSSIGNQSLLNRLKGQFPELSEDAFRAAIDGLIEQGLLQKGSGRVGSVLRFQSATDSLADQALSKARERLEPAAVAEVSSAYIANAVVAVSKGRAAKVQAARAREAMEYTHWATADNLPANTDPAEHRHIVLELIFPQYISDSFADRGVEQERKVTADNAYLREVSPEALGAELDDRYYCEVKVFWGRKCYAGSRSLTPSSGWISASAPSGSCYELGN